MKSPVTSAFDGELLFSCQDTIMKENQANQKLVALNEQLRKKEDECKRKEDKYTTDRVVVVTYSFSVVIQRDQVARRGVQSQPTAAR